MDAQDVLFGLLQPEGINNPYPLYAALHEHGDVIPAGNGLYMVPGYEVASAVLRDPGYLVLDAEMQDQIHPDWREHPSLDPNNLLMLNGEDHTRIRSMMARQVTRRRMAELEPAVIRLTDALLDSMIERAAEQGGVVDFMAEFGFALPVAVICELIGVPPELRTELRSLARALTLALGPLLDDAGIASADVAAVKLADMFADLIAERRARPRDDLLSALVAGTDAEPGRISESELIQNLILLLVAGFETTTNLLGNGVLLVLGDPSTGAALRSGAVSPEAFVEEVLRYDSPVQVSGDRRPVSPTEVAGVRVGPGDHLIVLIGAANRDPDRFAEPDRFWPERPDAGPLSFGGGVHFCLGATLARLEGALAFSRLLRKLPGLALAGEPQRRAGLVLRGFEHLPVTLG